MKYKHLFFDLDHTLWDYNANAKLTLSQLYSELELEKHGISDFQLFYTGYLQHNDKLWARYRKGYIKAEELRWKRMWHALLEFKNGDEQLARHLGDRFVELLPGRNILFPGTVPTLTYLRDKGYGLHLITNGFKETQFSKLRNCAIDHFFVEVITSEASNSMKPKKEIFDYALQKAGALAAESVMIGDCPEADIGGARNAGIDQIFMNHTGAECPVKPTYMVHSVNELKTIL